MNQISICTIMKNEERHLEAYIKAIQEAFFDTDYEIILLDTGSTDRSVEIGLQMGARVEKMVWQNDFALAKNTCISYAKYPTVLVLDCDEYIEKIDVQKLFAKMDNYPQGIGMICRRNLLKDGKEVTDYVEKLFDKRKFHYVYAIHEQIRTLEGKETEERIYLPLTAIHHGYETQELLKEKAERNKTLLDKMLVDSPEDPYLLYQRGRCQQVVEDYEGALSYYEKALAQDVNPKLSYVQLLIVDYGNALMTMGREAEALALEGIYEDFSFCGDYVYLMGMIYMKNGLWESALKELQKATTFSFTALSGANSYLAHYHRGCIYEVTGNLAEARNAYKKCGDFAPAQNRLQELGL